MNTFYLRVISSNKIFFEGRVEKIILPLEDGEKAVLAHHENMVIATSIGEIRITTSKGEQVVGVVGEGFVQIVNNRVVLIVDSAEKPEDIDRVRAKVTVFIVDMADFQAVNSVYSETFGADAPARSCVAVAALPKGARVEIEAIAVL